jgi:hypothetical protein
MRALFHVTLVVPIALLAFSAFLIALSVSSLRDLFASKAVVAVNLQQWEQT